MVTANPTDGTRWAPVADDAIASVRCSERAVSVASMILAGAGIIDESGPVSRVVVLQPLPVVVSRVVALASCATHCTCFGGATRCDLGLSREMQCQTLSLLEDLGCNSSDVGIYEEMLDRIVRRQILCASQPGETSGSTLRSIPL